MNGYFITFEGIEGSGKTTQIRLLSEHLRARGLDTVLTREPGGTTIGDRIRDILLAPDHAHLDPVAELLLYNASRRQHITEVIAPARAAGKIVLCDRYADATRAYQGAARSLDAATVETLHRIATDNLEPDLTILIDCPVDWGLGHAVRRNRELNLTGTEDRFEREARDFHERVRAGYLAIARRAPDRVKVIDGARAIDEVQKDVLRVVDKLIQTN